MHEKIKREDHHPKRIPKRKQQENRKLRERLKAITDDSRKKHKRNNSDQA